ncbi:MAG: tetratricopeptide repeat protein [Isosphaeraceae bacterium]
MFGGQAMSFRDRPRSGTPGQEIKNFTDREQELALFERLLDVEEPAHLPALMFFGVGGRGKSWLRQRLRNALASGKLPTLPSAYVDFDRQAGGPSYVADFSNLLAEVWRQLDVECPRFETAYSWMLFKQGAGDRPLVRQSGKVSTGWELVKEGASAGLGWVPGFNLVVWATDKLAKRGVARFEKSPLGEHLLKQAGQEDYLRLGRMTAQEIYPTLTRRLGEDLDEQLPPRPGKRCRAVVFLDTFEDVAGGEKNPARRQQLEEPVRELYHELKPVFLVLFGRDRLTWDEVEPGWADTENLVQHSLGGLSRYDALIFLNHCGVESRPLREAILRVARDVDEPSREAYLPVALGLCADTVQAEKGRGVEPSPNDFDMAPGDYAGLARRFLKSLHDEHPAQWIVRLAQTPRFDETAARAMFSAARDVLQDTAWESLPDYSFVQEDIEPGWYRIHSVMRDVLRRQLKDDEPGFRRAHEEWQAHWSSRSQQEFDAFAALAWYHDYVLDPAEALTTWKQKAKDVLGRNMAVHFALIEWWAPTEIEHRAPRTPDEAAALVNLGVELWQATLGNRRINLGRAIACFEAALRVYTRSEFPAHWAMVQDNLGTAHRNLPTGDRGVNLRRAIAYYEAALEVCTKPKFPAEWAMTQTNLGTAYADLPAGDRGANLDRAIEYYKAALQVFNKSEFPAEWAATQNNLGIAYQELPTGDRVVNLGLAIECYRAALQVRTESEFPAEWAGTQNNLGLAYQHLPRGDRRANLDLAIECYEAALRVRTEKDSPAKWAMTQSNLGFCLRDRGKLKEALRAFEAAARGFELVGDAVLSRRAKDEAEMTRKAIDSAGGGGDSDGESLQGPSGNGGVT